MSGSQRSIEGEGVYFNENLHCMKEFQAPPFQENGTPSIKETPDSGPAMNYIKSN